MTAWLCLLAYLLAGALGVHGLVLCVGPHGHVAIEAAAPGNCGGCLSGVTPLRDSEPGRLGRLPACPCDDVALPGAGVATQKLSSNRWVDPDPQPLPVTPAALGVFDGRRVPSRACERAADANRAASARSRSVVLRV